MSQARLNGSVRTLVDTMYAEQLPEREVNMGKMAEERQAT